MPHGDSIASVFTTGQAKTWKDQASSERSGDTFKSHTQAALSFYRELAMGRAGCGNTKNLPQNVLERT